MNCIVPQIVDPIKNIVRVELVAAELVQTVINKRFSN